jgi:hypothetical protein
VPGEKLRVLASVETRAETDTPMSGLTKTPGEATPWWRRLWPKIDIFGTAGK